MHPITFQSFCQSLRENKPQSELNLHLADLTIAQFRVLIATLKKNTTVTKVDLSEALKYIVSLEDQDEVVKLLAELLTENTTIQTLDLSHNVLGLNEATWRVFASALQNNHALIDLNLHSTALSPVAFAQIFESLKSNHTLKSLDLGYNFYKQASEDVLMSIAAMLQVNQTLQRLYLRYNKFSDDKIPVLAEALSKNQAITHLDLGGNWITDLNAFAPILKTNSTLKHLDLSFNKLRSELTQKFLDTFRKHGGLHVLNVTYNEHLNSQLINEIARIIKNHQGASGPILQETAASEGEMRLSRIFQHIGHGVFSSEKPLQKTADSQTFLQRARL